MKYLKRWWIDLQLTSHIFWRHIFGTIRLAYWIPLFIAIVFILQWLFNIDQLWDILTNESMSLLDKYSFLQEGFVNIFRYADDIVPISIILIAAFQASAIVLFFVVRQSRKKVVKQQVGSLAVGLIGSGCVACGGSILTPLLGAVASNVSVALAERISDILLVVAVMLSYRALSQISLVYAREVAK